VKGFFSLFRLNLLGNQYPALHGLRVLGILSVIQIHLSFDLGAKGVLARDSAAYVFSQRIWFGMDLFFFLSGFLIGSILLAAPEETRGRSIARFYARRSFRIIPLYYVVLTLLALTTRLDPLQRAQLPREYLYLTNYSDIGHVVMFWGWSLCVEEHFYLAVPLLMALLRFLPSHRARIVALVLAWLSGALVRGLVVQSLHVSADSVLAFQALYIPTHARFDILLAGVLLAYLMHTEGDRLRALFARPRVRLGSALMSLLLFGALLFPPSFVSPIAWWVLALGTVTGLAYFNLILFLVTGESLLARMLGARVFLRFATLGYGVYLVHVPLVIVSGVGAYVGFTRRLGLGAGVSLTLATLFVFALCLVEAYVLHLLVEKPALRLRDLVAPTRGKSSS
jgi:peptidoglycan/LPS O-acetylase OafA/YrhL